MDSYTIVNLSDSGELEIKFGRRSRLQIKPWRDGFQLHIISGKRRDPAQFHYMSLFTPEIEGRNDPGIDRFLSDIPVSVRDAVRPYSGFAQISLIHWARQFSAAQDLLHSNPLLLWLMAIGVYDGRLRIGEVPGLLDQKQRCILSKLTRTNASRSAVKMMSKIPLEQAGLSEGRVLLDVLANEEVIRLLRHTRGIPISLLGLFDRNPASIESGRLPKLLPWAEKTTYEQFVMNHSSRGPAIAARIERNRDRKKTGPRSHTLAPNRSTRTCCSENGSWKLLDHQTYRPTFGKQGSQFKTNFPLPPIPDNDRIKAIRNVNELETESKNMSHCVKSYRESVEKGVCYIYRVLYPERGTLELRRQHNGELGLGQFKLARNREPSEESWLCVKAWFGGYPKK